MKLIKKIGWYLLELIAVFAVLYGLTRGMRAIEDYTARTYDTYIRITSIIAYPFVFGVLIRVPSLIRRWSSDNGFHWLRFWVLVAPVLLLFAQIYSAFLFEINLWLPPFAFSETAFPLLGAWVGINLMDCIKGKPRAAKEKVYSPA